MERDFPPFGAIPALIPGDLQLWGGSDRAALYLAGFFAMPHGVLAGFHSVTRADELQGAEFAFEVLDGQPSAGALAVWAEFVAPGSSDPVRVSANLAAGGGGRDGGVDARTYRLWFPVDIPSLESDLRFWMRWDDAGILAGPLSIAQAQLREASRSAVSVA